MTSWRLATLTVLLAVVGVPLAVPLLEFLRHPSALAVWDEAPRLLLLSANTLLLVSGTLAIAVPLGLIGAVLFYRTDLPGRGLLRWATVLSLFVPLPLYASAWQAALGRDGVFTRLLPIGIWHAPQLWAVGPIPAIWVHAAAGLPWIIWLTGQGLCWVERELEEDALQVMSPWRVLWRVTLRRSWAALAVAVLWLALQTATEVTITDMMQVRTFAEEVYTQFVRPEREAGMQARAVLARAVAVNLPAIGLTWGLLLAATLWWQRAIPPLLSRLPPPRLYGLGWARWPAFVLVLLLLLFLTGVPVGSLLWKLGASGYPERWSFATAAFYLDQVWRAHGWIILQSLLLASVAGLIAAGAALVACWLGLDSLWFRLSILALIAAAWAIPGPIIGIGLKETINALLGLEEGIARLVQVRGPGPLRVWLYDGPSLAPVLWVDLVRFVPCAVAMLWPVIRLFPNDLRDAARVDGARPWQELGYVVFPITGLPFLRAALAVAVLSLGEVSAGKLVETPRGDTFAHQIFTEMHFGVSNTLAAMCLVLLLLVGAGGAVVALIGRWRGHRMG